LAAKEAAMVDLVARRVGALQQAGSTDDALDAI
jgi:hypothetical protein